MNAIRTRRVIDEEGAAAVLTAAEETALTQAGARAAVEAVAAAAAARGVAPVVSAVDAGGALVYLDRPDEAQVASVDVTTDKARTAAIYRRPSKDFEDQATGGRPSALHLARAVPLQGGIPIVHDGEVIGAIGVSGASSADEDQELAVLGARAFAAATSEDGHANGAAFFSNDVLHAKFRQGGLLLDTQRYKLDAGRRSAPGEVEFHRNIVDVMHVVEGTARVVTGGEMRDAREVAPGELPAPAVVGGIEHELEAGGRAGLPP